MAIVLQKSRHSINFFGIGITLFLIGFLGFAAYYVFFAPTPKFDAILPAPLKQANELQTINFKDPEGLITNPRFTRLSPIEGSPGLGDRGRRNPFAPIGVE